MYVRPQLVQCFQQAAWVVGAELEIHDGWGDMREIPMLTARLAGVSVEATIERGGAAMRTVVRARARGALGLTLTILPGGARGARTGDAAFDGWFRVEANDDRFADLWLDAHVRRRLCDTRAFYSPYPFRFDLTDEVATGRRKGLEEDPETLVRALNAAAALGARGRALLDDWRELADRLGGTVVAPDGTWRADTRAHIDIRIAGARVVIDAVYGVIAEAETRRCLITRVSCARASLEADSFRMLERSPHNPLRPTVKRATLELAADDTPLAASYAIRCQDRARLIARLDEATRKAILTVRPAAILGNAGQVSLLLLGFERTSERLEAAVGLARALAVEIDTAGMAGPYR